jgi:hypothetical protein
VWYGCQKCQGLARFGCFWEDNFCQVSESRNCSYFHPPNILKFTHNLFLKHDVANVECVITVTGEGLSGNAKWEACWRCMNLTGILCIACCSKWLKPCSQCAMTFTLSVPCGPKEHRLPITETVWTEKQMCGPKKGRFCTEMTWRDSRETVWH